MKSLIALTVLLLAVVFNQISVSSARTEPVCSYKNIQGETIFLKYFSYTQKGQEYVDFREDGVCVKRATCTETYTTVVEECKDFNVTCDNKRNYNGVFPACCVKCKL